MRGLAISMNGNHNNQQHQHLYSSLSHNPSSYSVPPSPVSAGRIQLLTNKPARWILALCAVFALVLSLNSYAPTAVSQRIHTSIPHYDTLDKWSASISNLGATRQKTVPYHQDPRLVQDKYSIIVSTFNRVEHLQHFLNRVANGQLPSLDAVYIAWGLGAVDPPEWLNLTGYEVPVHLERAQVNSLTERFRVPSKMRTNVGLWIDDDLQIHPDDLEFGFTVFKELSEANHRITGYSHRQIRAQADLKYTYELYQPDYSMVLTNSAFMDRQMLEWFWSKDDRMQESIAYVDKHMNCEDILMNFVVSEHTGLPPLLVDAYDVQQLQTHGISDQPGHYHERSDCVQAFIDIWGMPLRTTDIKIIPSTKEVHRRTVPLDKPFDKPFVPWASDKSFVAPGSQSKAKEELPRSHDKRSAKRRL